MRPFGDRRPAEPDPFWGDADRYRPDPLAFPPAERSPAAAPPGFSLQDILLVLYRHKGKMVLYFLAVMLGVAFVTANTPAEYRSESKLFVKLGRENVALDPTATLGQGITAAVPYSREDEINSVVEMLDSRTLLERIVDHFGASALLGRPVASERLAGTEAFEAPPRAWDPPTEQELELARARYEGRVGPPEDSRVWTAGLPLDLDRADAASWWKRLSPFEDVSPREQAIGHLYRRLHVEAVKKSTIIEVSYEGRAPDLAQAVVKKLVELYLDEHVRLNRTEGSRAFFKEQTQELSARLQEAEQKLRDLKDQTGVASIDDQRRILVERIGSLEDELLGAEADLAVARSEVATLGAKLAELPEMLITERSSGIANEAADGMRQQLYLLQLKEQELRSKYTDDMPAVREIRRQIREAQAILSHEEANRTQVKSSRNPAYEQTEIALLNEQAAVASLQAKAASVRRQLEEARSGLATLNDTEMRIAQLQRELGLQEESYRKYSANLEQVRIDQALEDERISNISIVQPATYESKPVRPKKLVNLGLGFLFATFGALGLAVVAEFFERSPVRWSRL